MFTQEELNKIIAESLERERKKIQEERSLAKEEVPPNEGEIDYKAKLEESRAEEAELLKKIDTMKKQNALVLAGYSIEQSTKYYQFVTGSTDEEIAASIENLKQDVKPKGHSKGVDPYHHGKQKKSIWNPWR